MELVKLDLSKAPGSCDGAGLSGCMRLFPHRLKGEGHFLALLRKGKGGSSFADSSKKEASQRKFIAEIPDKDTYSKAGERQKDLKNFLSDITMKLDMSRVVIHQEQVCYLPQGLEWKLPLRFLRTGLLMGEIKKGRFEPSQALAMALKADQYSNVLRLKEGDQRILRYLKGETLSLAKEERLLAGWSLVVMDEFPLGWCKGMGMSLKNKYYPGWRWQ